MRYRCAQNRAEGTVNFDCCQSKRGYGIFDLLRDRISCQKGYACIADGLSQASGLKDLGENRERERERDPSLGTAEVSNEIHYRKFDIC